MAILNQLLEVVAERDAEVGVLDLGIAPSFFVGDIYKTELIVDAKIDTVPCVAETYAKTAVETLEATLILLRVIIGTPKRS